MVVKVVNVAVLNRPCPRFLPLDSHSFQQGRGAESDNAIMPEPTRRLKRSFGLVWFGPNGFRLVWVGFHGPKRFSFGLVWEAA